MKRSHEYTELDLFSECGENVQVEKVLWDEFPCEDVLTNEISELNFTLRACGDKTLVVYGSNHDEGRGSLWVTTLEPFENNKTQVFCICDTFQKIRLFPPEDAHENLSTVRLREIIVLHFSLTHRL